jgi:hypothetical protein
MVTNTIYYQPLYSFDVEIVIRQKEKKKKPLKPQRELLNKPRAQQINKKQLQLCNRSDNKKQHNNFKNQ